MRHRLIAPTVWLRLSRAARRAASEPHRRRHKPKAGRLSGCGAAACPDTHLVLSFSPSPSYHYLRHLRRPPFAAVASDVRGSLLRPLPYTRLATQSALSSSTTRPTTSLRRSWLLVGFSNTHPTPGSLCQKPNGPLRPPPPNRRSDGQHRPQRPRVELVVPSGRRSVRNVAALPSESTAILTPTVPMTSPPAPPKAPVRTGCASGPREGVGPRWGVRVWFSAVCLLQ